MKPLFYCAAILLSGGAAAAQTAPAAHTYTSDLGFTYAIPADWTVSDANQAKTQAAQSAGSETEKKGLACLDIGFRAQHGNPPSVIVEVALPFACYGQQLTAADLPGFAEGASQGLKQQFDIEDPSIATYSLGTHQVWIERVKGSPKGAANVQYTIEIACTPLKNAAACWMTLAADEDSLKAFENGAVTLDSDAATPLVPKTAFDKKP